MCFRILEGVVFAVSGFSAAQRDDIRNKATAMGAKYRHGSVCKQNIFFPDIPKLVSVFGPNFHVLAEIIFLWVFPARHRLDDTCTHLVCNSDKAAKYNLAASGTNVVFSLEDLKDDVTTRNLTTGASARSSRSCSDELTETLNRLSLGSGKCGKQYSYS